MEDVYRDLEGISFDHAIMEKTEDPVFVIPCECGWSDVGSWASLYDLREGAGDRHRNLKEGESVLIDCQNSFVSGQGGRLVACLGLKNCLVVDTPDALLVADLERAQDIRKIVEHLRRTQKEELL
jgi:mannose-1-phosphate guanylyltransferase